jgi:pyruvate/2-oxoglutarate dehydrogenase complex dihydrolipoamide acyltransferase (E2) component
MSALIILPRMGETMESGRVTAWLKKPGDNFQRGETIAEIETDKVTVEMPALDSGTLVEILVPEGAEVVVGAPLGRYDSAGASRATRAKRRGVNRGARVAGRVRASSARNLAGGRDIGSRAHVATAAGRDRCDGAPPRDAGCTAPRQSFWLGSF